MASVIRTNGGIHSSHDRPLELSPEERGNEPHFEIEEDQGMPPRDSDLALILKVMVENQAAAERRFEQYLSGKAAGTGTNPKWVAVASGCAALITVLVFGFGTTFTSSRDAAMDKRVSLLEQANTTLTVENGRAERDRKLLEQYNRELVDFLHSHNLNPPKPPVLGGSGKD